MQERTKRQLDTVILNPPHSLLVAGAPGSGKIYLSNYLAAKLIGVEAGALESAPFFFLLSKPEGKQEIPIEDVRKVIRKLILKTSGMKRIVLIEGAHLLSEEAQNALLKNIEEPPPNTHFILSVPSASMVLPTIASRSQKLSVKPVSLAEASDYFQTDYSASDILSAWSLSRGGAGLISAILKDDNGHPLKLAVEQAKSFLMQDSYERAISLDKLGSDKNAYTLFLDALDRLLSALASASIRAGKSAQSKRLIAARLLIDNALSALSNNSSPRLVSLYLAQQLTI